MTDKSYTILEGRGVLAIGGEDRVEFLQGLVSNDVTKLEDGAAQWAAFLTPQGKYLHDFFLVGHGDDILVDCEGGERLVDFKRRLTMYKLRAKVTVEDRSEELAVAALMGEGATDDVEGAVVYADPRLPEAGARAILSRDGGAAVLETAGFAAAGFDDWDRHRIRLGLPDGSRDLIPERSILLENGFDELNGVSFDKGCYMGQELTARTKHRALIRKRLMPVEIDGPAPEAGTPLLLDDKDAGKMRSSCGDVGLAMVRLEELEAAEGTPFSCGEATLTPVKPGWVDF